jgi:spore maturation protein CgeB
MKIVVIGLSITSSWGNGHATTYRALLREFAARGHEVLFLERDVPWYAAHRDFTEDDLLDVALYGSFDELDRHHSRTVREADAVIVGSYVPEGARIINWVLGTAFGTVSYYDIDTPVTLERLRMRNCDYLDASQIPEFDLVLSFAGGRTLSRLESEFGARRAVAFHCSVDPALYYPEKSAEKWLMGYLGTYSDDRQPGLEKLLLGPAERWAEGNFVVAGPQYPDTVRWPANVERIEHLPPANHRGFYNSQRFTLNLTRADMKEAGHAPSVRLFEAAACGTPIISDRWDGLEEIFEPGKEILIVDSGQDVLEILREISPDEAARIGAAGREKVLADHTAAHRAEELEHYLIDISEMSLAVPIMR